MRTVDSILGNFSDKAGALAEDKLNQALKANHAISDVLGSNANNAYFGMSAMQAKAAYRKLYSYGSILQCQYAVYLNDIFNIQKNIPNAASWFGHEFPLSWLATDTEVSLGSFDSESFYAGSFQCNYLTQQTSDTLDVTFIETKNMDISKSYKYCSLVTAGDTGSMREPKHYTFELVVAVLGNRRDLQHPAFEQRHLVAVKEANFSVSSAGRNEIIKVQVTFQKIRPHGLFKNSVAWK